MNNEREKGIALIITLILVFVMSVMAISLMFVSQSETWSSLNYRLMSQTRDGAEAGINSGASFIVNSYTEPGGAGDPTSAYNTSASPVQYPASSTSGHDVILSGNTNQSSNYPVSSVQTAFNTSGVGYGSLTAGNATVQYNAYAKLLSMHTAFTPFGTTVPTTVQTWQIVSDGNINGIRSATVEVSAILEQHITPTFNYAVFGTSNGCNALQFGGGGSTNSYDSSTVVIGTTPTFSNTDGNVGTNGNLSTNGNPTTVNGNLYTPRTGVGVCTSSRVTAWTDSSGHVTGSLVELPQPIIYPTPAAPSPIPPTTNATLHNSAADCSGVTGCTFVGADFYLAPGTCPNGATTYGNLQLKGNVHFSSGCYNINSLTENANGTVIVDSGPVIVNLAGSGQTTPLDLTGNSVSNPSLVPNNFQVIYAGSGNLKLAGGSAAAGLIYAPNASYSFTGNADWYGSVIGLTMTDMGGTAIHYDRRLKSTDYTIGPWMLDSFTWKKY